MQLPAVNLHRIQGELEPEQAALAYEQTLRQYATLGQDWPVFDLVLLGLGANGHTASLFPGEQHPAEAPVLAVTANYQGRPALRVTLTPLVFNTVRQILLLVAGEDKAESVSRVLFGLPDHDQNPAQRIMSTQGGLGWFLAAGAAGQQYPLALGLWLGNRLLDGLDGTLARLRNRQSDLGGYLDIVLDMVVYAAIPLGLAIGAQDGAVMLSLALLLSSFYINSAAWMYLSALLEGRSQGAKARGELTTVTMPGGLIEGLYFLHLLPAFSAMAVLLVCPDGRPDADHCRPARDLGHPAFEMKVFLSTLLNPYF